MLQVSPSRCHPSLSFAAGVLIATATAFASPQATGRPAEATQDAAAKPEAPSPQQRRPDLPAADAVIEQAVEAMGGEEAFASIGSVELRVSRTWPAEMLLETNVIPPDRMSVWQRVDEYNNEVTIIRNGDTSWIDDHRTGRKLQVPRDQAQLTFNLSGYPELMLVPELTERYHTIEMLSRTLYDGTQCYRIRLADEANLEPGVEPGDSFIYFSVESGLPIALEKAPRVERGYREVQRFRAWANLDELQLFTRVDIAKGHDRGIMKYDFIEFGSVDPEGFAIPDRLEQPAGERADADSERQPGMKAQENPPVEGSSSTFRGDLPAAEEVLEEAVDAMGGTAAFEAIDMVHLEVDVAAGRRQETHLIDFAPPDRLHARRPRPDGSALVIGMNGEFAWWQLPGREPIRVDESRLQQEEDVARTPWIVLDLIEEFDTIETVDRVDFDGTDCYKLRLRDPQKLGPGEVEGDRFAYFDAENGRIIGTEGPLLRDPGRYGTTLYRNWKEFGALTIFSRIETNQHGAPQTKIVKTIRFNDVDEAVFEVPEPVRNAPTPEAPRATPGGGPTGLGSSTGGGS